MVTRPTRCQGPGCHNLLPGRSPDPLGRGRPRLYCSHGCGRRARRARDSRRARARARAASPGRLRALCQVVAEAECGLRGRDQLARLCTNRHVPHDWTPRRLPGPPAVRSLLVVDDLTAVASIEFSDGSVRPLALLVDLDGAVLGWTWPARPSEAAA